jgi:hypothetical protein
MRPTTAYLLERLLRRRLRAALLKTACALLVLAALVAGWSLRGSDNTPRRPASGLTASPSPTRSLRDRASNDAASVILTVNR